MTKKHRPRRGSLQFSPRKKAKKLVPRVGSWPSTHDGVLGLLGYKVGSTTAIVEITSPDSRLQGKEKSIHATVLEVPPLTLRAIRVYKKTPYGTQVVGDYSNLKKVPELSDSNYTALLFETNPKAAGHPEKQPQIIEAGFGGDALAFAKENINKPLAPSQVFKPSEFIDITAVTKGRGFQGVIKRFGVPLLPSKTEKSRRKVGSLGPWTPKRTAWQVPMAGQTGFHKRTEYNKEILAMGEGDQINPKSGWPRFGLVKSNFVVLKGSVPGPAKRPVWLRKASRPGEKAPHSLKHLIYRNEVIKL